MMWLWTHIMVDSAGFVTVMGRAEIEGETVDHYRRNFTNNRPGLWHSIVEVPGRVLVLALRATNNVQFIVYRPKP